MASDPRLSSQTLKVLSTMLSSSANEMAGAEIGRAAKLASGTLYPILMRLEEAGWLISRWETNDPKALGRPRKRFYQITRLGAQKTRAAFKEFQSGLGNLIWN